VHFVDGGYYDNDGTASAIEFLRYALAPSATETSDPKYPKPDPIAALNPNHRLRILIIEIRNSGDISPTGPETSGEESDDQFPWNALSQVGAPALAFWQAGHESVTGRNRSALGLLEQAFSAKLEIHRVVFADANSKKFAGTDPLNWSLTPIQRAEVRTSVVALTQQDEEVRCWFSTWEEMWNNAQQPIPMTTNSQQCLVPVPPQSAVSVSPPRP
jgi:hypothetical protein